MDRKEKVSADSGPFVVSELFAETNGPGYRDAAAEAGAVRKLHARLSSSEFVEWMTGIFFEAKRAALTSKP